MNGSPHAARRVALLYLLLIAIAEVMVFNVNVMLGLMLHAILIPLLIVRYAANADIPEYRLLVGLTILPLMRILSLAAPLTRNPAVTWGFMVGAPILVATGIAIFRLRLRLSTIGLGIARPGLVVQPLVLVGGVFLAYFVHNTFYPEMKLFALTDLTISSPVAIAYCIFNAVIEELLFRGVLQTLAIETFGNFGIVYASLLFAVMYIGSQNWQYILFMLVLALFLGIGARISRSIWAGLVVRTLVSLLLL
jgi:membrane protease YdiL (CAAX protease family)